MSGSEFTKSLAWLGLGLFSLLAYRFLKGRDNKLPGPTRLPVIGNVHQMPLDSPWLTFMEWKKKYGDIIEVDILGRPFVIINSAEIARDLMDKRSSLYSDRPHLIMAGDLVGYGETFVLQPYGENWRQQRKIVTQDFGPSTIPRYYPLQEKEARLLARNVLEDPSCLLSQIKLRIGIIILRVTYGYYVQGESDPFLTTPLTAMENFSTATVPGNFMVDFLPFMLRLPPWMPGAGFLKTAKAWREVVYDATYNPYNWSKKNLATGKTLLPSMCGTMVQEAGGELPHEIEERLVWAASAVMGGGMDTSMSTTLSFFLAMILHPDIQRKAQAEVDSVVGTDRLPKVTDRDSLPYVRSIITELLRWNPAVPMGLPHAVIQDDIYDGMKIKRGSIIMANVWSMLHDPLVYTDPLSFNPDRYNNKDEEMKKVYDLVFGFGRRACPGSNFAFGTLYAIVLTIFATCDILPALDINGKEIIPRVKYSSGTISFPEPFDLRLKHRSSKAEALLAEVSADPE